ncbi:MAG: peptidoglycan synthetase, partial [Flavobacteriaceae bacterium]|nr:peptidoglycan synthetase [Flavobacteriaceae bacterium]
GYKITGSDDSIFEPSKSRLDKKGLLPKQLGWSTDNINDSLDAVVLGMHAKDGNVELEKAKELGLKIYSYPEFIYEMSKGKTRVVIGGSHGKTTITSMILHVLNYHEKDVDYMVGAQLDGFETMVKLTEENDFIILEGDEYLSSALDLRPKFHLYNPNIALISGIAWDHINVFETEEKYNKQFDIFIDKIASGGMLVYNSEDKTLNDIAENNTNPIKKYPYETIKHSIVDGITYIETPEGDMDLEIFGLHNISNLSGAKWICQLIGIDEMDFFEAIQSFKGASKRLEKIYQSEETVIYKDFAHSPSKVDATNKSVKAQYKNRKLISVFELHTYSSLNPDFIGKYKDSLNSSDNAIVFMDEEALKIKGKNFFTKQEIRKAFNREDIEIMYSKDELLNSMKSLDYNNSVVLMMSSGNYSGIELSELPKILGV